MNQNPGRRANWVSGTWDFSWMRGAPPFGGCSILVSRGGRGRGSSFVKSSERLACGPVQS
jgi:hypothetical protein